MYYQKKHLSNDFAVNENNASNQNEQEEQQVSCDINDIESNQNDIEEAAEEQVIDDDDNFNSDQSEIDEQEIEINASNQNEQQESIDEQNSESDPNEIEEPAEEQMINDDVLDQSEIDDQKVQAIDDDKSTINSHAIKIEQQEIDAIQRLICKKTFANEQELRDHLENDYESESVSEQSDDSFESSLNGESNVDEKVEEHLQCEICNKSFSDIKQLLNHFDSIHDKQNLNPRKTHLSNDISTALNSNQPANNAIKESDIVQCNICEKNLQRHALPKHMQQVHTKNPFTCDH